MSQHATVTRPYNPRALFGAGPATRGPVIGTPRLSMWHPALPEVVRTVPVEAREGLFASGTYFLGASSNPFWPFPVWRKILPLAALLLALAAPAFAAPAPCVVNVTTCTPVTCAYLPGVGQVTGGLISHAHPKNESELDAVKGIGPKRLEVMRPFVVYGDAPTTCTGKQTAPKSTGGAK